MDSLTQLIVVFTAIGSVAVFAIPASMLAWGFEAEAERLIRLRDEKRGHAESMPNNSGSCVDLFDEFAYEDDKIECSSDSSNWFESDKEFYVPSSDSSDTEEEAALIAQVSYT